ncbi:MAG: hypothetical protein JST81_14690 [Bacteroidetes bacterium]|nr:hypothetical protein [Bacteroidota bacterium]
MKSPLRIFAFIVVCLALVTVSLYAGRSAYSNCDQCHYFSNGKMIRQPDPFLQQTHTIQFTKY